MPVACYEHGDQFERLNDHQWNSQHQERRIGTELLKPPAKVFRNCIRPHAVQVSVSTPKGAGVLAMRDRSRSRRGPEALSCSKRPSCPKAATLRNLDEPGCGRGATAFAPRGQRTTSPYPLHIRVKPDGKLNGSGQAGEKGPFTNLLIDRRKCARAPAIQTKFEIQAMQTFKPCRPSKQH